MAAEGSIRADDSLFDELLELAVGCDDARLVRSRLRELLANVPHDLSQPRAAEIDTLARMLLAGFREVGSVHADRQARQAKLDCMARLDREMLTRGPAQRKPFQVLTAEEMSVVRDFCRRMRNFEDRLFVGVQPADQGTCDRALDVLCWNHLNRDSSSVRKTAVEFREAADIVIKLLTARTIEQMGLVPENTVIGLMWRSALPMGAEFAARGFTRFVHINGQRRESDATTEIHTETRKIELRPDDIVVIPDPMLATGQSVDNALAQMGVKPGDGRKVVSMSVISAPEGCFFLGRKHSRLQFFTAALHECLNEAAFICKGLGDFGDNYMAGVEGALLDQFIAHWMNIGLLTNQADVVELRARFASHHNKV